MTVVENGDHRSASWTKPFLYECMRKQLSPTEFLAALSNAVEEHGRNEFIPNILAGHIVDLATFTSTPNESVFDYLDCLLAIENITWECYVGHVTAFSGFERSECVRLLVRKLEKMARTIKCTFSNEDECLRVAELLYRTLAWMFAGISATLKLDNGHELSGAKALFDCAVFYRSNKFAHLAVFTYLQINPDAINALIHSATEAVQAFHNGAASESEEEHYQEFLGLVELAESFGSVPSSKIEDFSEVVTVKKIRPAILTLGSIYASFRVLKPNEEMAQSFLVLGRTLQMPDHELVVDILRAGFLIQLEAVERDREALADMFVYLRAPQILPKLVELGVSATDLYKGLEKVSRCATLLNLLDCRKRENTFQNIVEKLHENGHLTEEQSSTLVQNRNTDISQHPKLLEILKDQSESAKPTGQHPGFHHLRLSLKAKNAFTFATVHKLTPLIARLMQSGDINVDAVCSVFCADGDLPMFSVVLASINKETERQTSTDPEDVKNRILMFDSSFTLLARIKYVYMDLRLEELVGEHTTGAFYRWMHTYWTSLESGKPMPVDPELKMNFFNQVTLLKTGKPFWNETWDFSTMIEHVPVIGDILLDEYKNRQHNENEIRNVLSTFQDMTCLLLCLVQWLETQPVCPAIQAFAETLRNFSNTHSEQIQDQPLKKRWVYTFLVAKKSLMQLTKGRRHREQPYTWLVNCGRRQLPPVHQTDVPDAQMLKEAFLYANQQGWASPDVIAHVERSNKCAQFSMWTSCWLQQTTKSQTADELEAAAELCIGATMTSLPSMVHMARTLVDLVLDDSPSKISFPIHQISAVVLARMLLRVLMLVLWADERRDAADRQKRLSRKRKADGDGSFTDDFSGASTSSTSEPMDESGGIASDLPGTSADFLTRDDSTEDPQIKSRLFSKNPVTDTIKTIFARFEKQTRTALLRPPVTFLVFFLNELAKAPRTEQWHALMRFVTPDMVFVLGRLEPNGMSLPVVLSLYDINEEKNRALCLKYACMLRKIGAL